MKTTFASSLALVACLSMAVPAGAQSPRQITTQPNPGETATAFAERINACGGSNIVSAAFVNDVNDAVDLRVRCPAAAAGNTSGMAGGLGAAGVAAIAGGVALVAFAIGSSGGSSTPSTN